jgi:alpha-tubulin suppressor-like RCC1 family protein
VTISDVIAGATIHYTTNGLAPTTSDPVIDSGGTVTVNATTMLRARAFKSGMTTSDTKSGLYQIGAQVVAGWDYSLALQTNGTLWAWGRNDNGQLGDGTTTVRSFPEVVGGISNVWVAAGDETHTIAADANGTVWTWGYNGQGQLGNGTYTNYCSPLAISGVSKVVRVAVGEYHTMAVKSDGTVWTWGQNNYGTLGIGSSSPDYTNWPVQAVGLTQIIGVTAGAWHSVALRANGTVWTWGNNGSGQLGYVTCVDHQSAPEQVGGITDVVAIAAGYDHTVALRADGTVWAWGDNDDGQLGDGTGLRSSVPVQAVGLSNVVAIAAGQFHTLAVTTNGNIYTWGKNYDYGELGLGNNENQSMPYLVGSLSGVQSISGGKHSLAVKSDGTIWAWGSNVYRQLGQCTTVQYVNTPGKVGLSVSSLPPIMATVSGTTNMCLGGFVPATLTGVPIMATLTGTGTGPWTVIWSDGFTQQINVPHGSVTNTVNPASTTTYTVIGISDSTCLVGVSSGSATVTVGPIVSQPTNQVACLGQSASFSVTSWGAAVSRSYQWRKGGVNLSNGPTGNGSTYSGVNLATLQINNVAARDAVSAYSGFDCVVGNACGSPMTSSRVGLTFSPSAVVSGSATTMVCSYPVSATIQAVLTGTGPWILTWSDGVITTNSSSPATRTVNPTSATIYTVTAISDSMCSSGISSGGAEFSCGWSACCLTNGKCAQLSQWACANQGGFYNGDGTSCTPSNPSNIKVYVVFDSTCTGADSGIVVDDAFYINGNKLLPEKGTNPVWDVTQYWNFSGCNLFEAEDLHYCIYCLANFHIRFCLGANCCDTATETGVTTTTSGPANPYAFYSHVFYGAPPAGCFGN